MKKLVSCKLEKLQEFIRLAELYGWDKTWAAFAAYLKTEKLRKKWTA